MGSTEKQSKSEEIEKTETRSSSHEKVISLITNELVIALCAPIGSPARKISKEIEKELQSRGYTTKYYKISERISKLNPNKILTIERLQRKKQLIYLGNQLRKTHGSEYLAEDTVSQIKITKNTQSTKSTKNGYIVDSLKNISEYELLKSIYGKIFYMIGIYSDKESRRSVLDPSRQEGALAEELIQLDYKDIEKSGQHIDELFHHSDLFLDASNDKDYLPDIKRFLDAIFGTEVVTPTDNERAMFSAWSAGLNSGCLSRQVGACITDSKGDIIGAGWNDAPSPNGGVYTTSKAKDMRCYNFPVEGCMDCRNDNEKNEISNQIANILIKNEFGSTDRLNELKDLLLGKTPLKHLIEFSRAIHAEMHCLFNSLKTSGDKIANGKIYITTYPCHNCAKHIIMSGIMEIYFIEPYPKSKAELLHRDALTSREESGKVMLKPFTGIAPSRFMSIFSSPSRKSKRTRNLQLPEKTEATHRHGINASALSTRETIASKSFTEKTENEQNFQ